MQAHMVLSHEPKPERLFIKPGLYLIGNVKCHRAMNIRVFGDIINVKTECDQFSYTIRGRDPVTGFFVVSPLYGKVSTAISIHNDEEAFMNMPNACKKCAKKNRNAHTSINIGTFVSLDDLDSDFAEFVFGLIPLPTLVT